MAPIVTITLNPALDMSSAVHGVRPDEKLRCDAPIYDPGGGGINVARAILQLGGTAQAFVANGGYRGAQLCELLKKEGVSVVGFRVEGETRLSLAVFDREDGQQYRFVMPGPSWDNRMVANVLGEIGKTLVAMERNSLVVLSGSHPPGVPNDFPAQLAVLARAQDARLMVDTSGSHLQELMHGSASPYVLRLDRKESETLAGTSLSGVKEVADFAQDLVERHVAQIVVLAMGSEGSVMVDGGQRWHAVTPLVKVQSKVGAGDSFVGAFTFALSRGETAKMALCEGVAAASAAVISDATDLCTRSDYEALRSKVLVSEV